MASNHPKVLGWSKRSAFPTVNSHLLKQSRLGESSSLSAEIHNSFEHESFGDLSSPPFEKLNVGDLDLILICQISLKHQTHFFPFHVGLVTVASGNAIAPRRSYFKIIVIIPATQHYFKGVFASSRKKQK